MGKKNEENKKMTIEELKKKCVLCLEKNTVEKPMNFGNREKEEVKITLILFLYL